MYSSRFEFLFTQSLRQAQKGTQFQGFFFFWQSTAGLHLEFFLNRLLYQG